MRQCSARLGSRSAEVRQREDLRLPSPPVTPRLPHPIGSRWLKMTVRPVKAASNALIVFEAVADEQPVGVSQLARSTGLDKSQVQRMLTTLYEAGWIMPTLGSPRRWQISSKPVTLVRSTRPLHLIELATTEMIRLRDATNETTILTALQAHEMVIIDIARSNTALRVQLEVGDAFRSVSGSAIALLAALPPESNLNFLRASEELEVRDRIAKAQELGYATHETEEWIVFASAMLDESAFPFAVLGLVAPKFRVSRGESSGLGRLVVNSARRVSQEASSPSR